MFCARVRSCPICSSQQKCFVELGQPSRDSRLGYSHGRVMCSSIARLDVSPTFLSGWPARLRVIHCYPWTKHVGLQSQTSSRTLCALDITGHSYIPLQCRTSVKSTARILTSLETLSSPILRYRLTSSFFASTTESLHHHLKHRVAAMIMLVLDLFGRFFTRGLQPNPWIRGLHQLVIQVCGGLREFLSVESGSRIFLLLCYRWPGEPLTGGTAVMQDRCTA